MSIGLPIITTNISANIEALGHTYPFFIDVNKQNDYQNAAMKINMLLTKENLYNNISRYLRTRFERNFSKEKMLKLYKELYEDIAETYLSNNKGLCLK
jgi:glycosyltransferase involved in cell wall biosynthesis